MIVLSHKYSELFTVAFQYSSFSRNLDQSSFPDNCFNLIQISDKTLSFVLPATEENEHYSSDKCRIILENGTKIYYALNDLLYVKNYANGLAIAKLLQGRCNFFTKSSHLQAFYRINIGF